MIVRSQPTSEGDSPNHSLTEYGNVLEKRISSYELIIENEDVDIDDRVIICSLMFEGVEVSATKSSQKILVHSPTQRPKIVLSSDQFLFLSTFKAITSVAAAAAAAAAAVFVSVPIISSRMLLRFIGKLPNLTRFEDGGVGPV